MSWAVGPEGEASSTSRRARPSGPSDQRTRRTSYKLRGPRGNVAPWRYDPDPIGDAWEDQDFLIEDEDETMALGPWKFPKNGEPYRKIREEHVRRYVHGMEADYSLKILNCLRILGGRKPSIRYVDPSRGLPTVEIYLDSQITTPGWYTTKEVIALFGKLGTIAQLGEAFINVSNDGLMSIGQFLRELENVRFIAPFQEDELPSPTVLGPSTAGVSTGFPQGEDPYGLAGGQSLPWGSYDATPLRGNNSDPDDPTTVDCCCMPLPRYNSSLEEIELFLEELCDSATWSSTDFPEMYVRKDFLKNVFFNKIPQLVEWYPRYRWISVSYETKLGNKGFLLGPTESQLAEYGGHPDMCPPSYSPLLRRKKPRPRTGVAIGPSDEGYW